MDINATEKLDSFDSVADETIKAESVAEPMVECGSTVKVKYTDGKYEILER